VPLSDFPRPEPLSLYDENLVSDSFMLDRVHSRRLPSGPWRALRTPSLRLWIAANAVSNAGAWMQMVAQNLLVLRLTGSVAMTGASLALQALPGLLFGVAGGALVDRWPRRLTAGLGQVALAMVALTTAVLATVGALNVPLLMVLGLLTGLVATVEGPACALLGNELVPVHDVPSAVALGSVAANAGRLAGTAAGALIATVGVPLAYAFNGLSFLLVAAVIPFLKQARVVTAEPTVESHGLTQGLRYLVNSRALLLLVLVGAVTSLLGRNYSLSMAALVTGPLGAAESAYGLVSSALAVGGIVGALLAGRQQNARLRTVVLLFIAAAGVQVLTGFAPIVAVLAIMVIPMAAAEAAASTATATMLQTVPPEQLRGRVLGAWRTASTTWGLAGPPMLGILLQSAGPRLGLIVGGLAVVLLLGIGRIVYRRRLIAKPLPTERSQYVLTA
jgi:MFS family permease